MTKESEIVRALRHTCDGCNHTPCCEFEVLGPEAADLIESLTAEKANLRDQLDHAGLVLRAYKDDIAASQRRERAAVEMLIKFIKQSDDACDYCKNHNWHRQCTIFDYGTCAMLANTPCNGCFENDCSGFEWRGPVAGEGERDV